MDQSLGKRICAHRKRLGLTQDQLAEKLDVTAQAVSKWENDQSCPDISTLPRLAEIFGISIDTLLGRSSGETVHQAEVVSSADEEDRSSGWEFHYDNSRSSGIGFAIFVVLTGILWLISNYFALGVGLWSIAWPCGLLIFGLFGLYPRFSFLRLGCAALGLYFLADNFSFLPESLSGKTLLLPTILIIFGLSLLMDSLRKPKKPSFSFTRSGEKHKEPKTDYSVNGDTFDLSASFGSKHQLIHLPRLRSGDISTSFGQYTVDLSGVDSVAPGCTLDVSNSFGELTLLIPKRYHILCDNSSAFGSIDIEGRCDGSGGVIELDASCSFGHLTIQYI